MPLEIVQNNITKMKVDAIVNAANQTLLGGGGVDGAIHHAAGPGLLAECRTLGGCETGNSKITGAYNLPCKYVIHTVGPQWFGGNHGERDKLISCYRKSLELAKDNNCETVAFPLISSGIYGYPKDKALNVAVDTISAFLNENDMTVYIVIFDKSTYKINEKLFKDISEYVDVNYADEHLGTHLENICSLPIDEAVPFDGTPKAEEMLKPTAVKSSMKANVAATLDEAVGNIDESFSEMLLRKIDEQGITDAECYKKANIDRKLFSKIRSNRLYKPSKSTVLAFAIALELSIDETKEMLLKAGFALSHSSKFDIIVEFFISHGIYNVFEINEALFAFDQSLLGA